MSDYATFAHRWFEEVWNKDNLAAIDQLAHPDAQAFDFPSPGSVCGREGFRDAVRQFRTAFSEIHITIDDVVSQDDKMAVRWTAEMKHTGPGLGFPPTGEAATIHGISFMQMRDGLLFRGWNAFDLATPVSHLSALAGKPPHATAG